MIGYHAVPVIADAYLKGVGDFDANEALDAMVASADYAPYGGLGDYMKLGYVARSEEHTSELRSLMRISYAVFCLKKKKHNEPITKYQPQYTYTVRYRSY